MWPSSATSRRSARTSITGNRRTIRAGPARVSGRVEVVTTAPGVSCFMANCAIFVAEVQAVPNVALEQLDVAEHVREGVVDLVSD